MVVTATSKKGKELNHTFTKVNEMVLNQYAQRKNEVQLFLGSLCKEQIVIVNQYAAKTPNHFALLKKMLLVMACNPQPLLSLQMYSFMCVSVQVDDRDGWLAFCPGLACHYWMQHHCLSGQEHWQRRQGWKMITRWN